MTETLCGQGSPASAELDDLFLDAMSFAFGDPDDPNGSIAKTARMPIP
jgi:hypothetical protein